MSLTRENILKPAIKPIEVPEWDGTVHIRKLPIKVINQLKGNTDKAGAVEWLIMCVVDEHGEPMFTADDKDQLESSAAYKGCMRVIEAAMEYNGFSNDAIEDASGN